MRLLSIGYDNGNQTHLERIAVTGVGMRLLFLLSPVRTATLFQELGTSDAGHDTTVVTHRVCIAATTAAQLFLGPFEAHG